MHHDPAIPSRRDRIHGQPSFPQNPHRQTLRQIFQQLFPQFRAEINLHVRRRTEGDVEVWDIQAPHFFPRLFR